MGIGSGTGFVPGSGSGSTPSIPVTVMPYGDSTTLGFTDNGLTQFGGWRWQMSPNAGAGVALNPDAIPWIGEGQFTDAVGLKHQAINGLTIAAAMPAFPAQWAANPCDELWLKIGGNDIINGATVANTLILLSSFLDLIFATVGPHVNVRVDTVQVTNNGVVDAQFVTFRQGIPRICYQQQALGRRCYPVNAAGSIIDPTDLDGFNVGGLQHPNNGINGSVGYGKWAGQLEAHFNSYSPVIPANAGGTIIGHYRADSVVLAGAGPGVQIWRDISGAGNHLLQAAGANQPSWRRSGIKYPSMPSVVFDGINDFMRLAGPVVAQPMGITIVSGPAGNANGVLIDSANPAAGQRIAIFGSTTQTTIFAGAGGLVDIDLRNTGYVQQWLVNGAATTPRFDANVRDVVNPGAGVMNGFTLGASAAAAPTLFFNGEIYEVIIRSGVANWNQVGEAHYARDLYKIWPVIGEFL